MSFKIDKVSLDGFRNFKEIQDDPSGNINLVLGDNAVGKTNYIEGIQLLTAMESFRNPGWEEVINWDENEALICIDVVDEKRKISISSRFVSNKRTCFSNGKKKTTNELRGMIPSVLFNPDDLRMVKDSSYIRRQALDQLGIQLSSGYSHMKNDYEKIVTQRNRLLKEKNMPDGLLESWTESLITIGALFYKNRKRLFSRIKDRFSSVFSLLVSSDDADIDYIPFWEGYQVEKASPEEMINEVYEVVKLREKEQKTTLVGPHKDELLFLINGRNARQYASQGQQRSLVLTWKLVEVEVIQDIIGKTPILLLDDVMSELDEKRRNLFLEYIDKKNIQTFITSANEQYFNDSLLSKAHILRL